MTNEGIVGETPWPPAGTRVFVRVHSKSATTACVAKLVLQHVTFLAPDEVLVANVGEAACVIGQAPALFCFCAPDHGAGAARLRIVSRSQSDAVDYRVEVRLSTTPAENEPTDSSSVEANRDPAG